MVDFQSHHRAEWPNFFILGKFLKVYLVFGKILILLWQICYAIGQVFIIVVDGQIFKQ